MDATWITASWAAAAVENSAGAQDPAWVADFEASVAYVERKRADLLSGTPPVFAADAAIKLGTAMLANRMHARRTSPLGTSQNVEFGGSDFLRQDPDIAKLLGIGVEGAFVVGGARDAELKAQGL